ncbi:MAG: hypothetical protein R3242_08285 [Akkermansiaceae bacterium]|nr:hypothetical protein [Akkermansiaceae bacterium]
MKTLTLSLCCLSLLAPAALAENAEPAKKAVPLDNFRIAMNFGSGDGSGQPYTYVRLTGSLESGQDKPEFKVSYLCGNVRDTQSGETTQYFPMTKSDVGTLIRVAASAANEEEMQVDVDYDNVNFTTSYVAVETDEGWKVIVKREQWLAEFDAGEGEKLGNRLEECMTTIAWYEKLFTASELPEPTADARPPTQVEDMSLSTSFGEVSMGDLGFRSDFKYGVREQIPANTHHQLAVHYIHQEPRKFEGPWVRDMMAKTTEAARAAENLEGYSFRARKKEMTYKITAWPNKKVAELKLHSDLGDHSFMAPTVEVDRKKADEVAEVIRRAEEFERWFAEHHALLAAYRPDPEIRKPRPPGWR